MTPWLVAVWGLSTARAEPMPVSLEQALTRAVQTSESREIAAAGVDRAHGEQWSARSGLLPQLSGSISYQHTFASEFDDVFEDSSGAGSAFGELPFGRKETWHTDLSLSQNVFSGGLIEQNRIARASLQLAEIDEESSRAQAAVDAASAYFDAALTDQLVAIAESGLVRAEVALEHTRVAYEAGVKPEFELLRAGVEVENQRVLVLQQLRIRELAYLRLAQLLDLADVEIELTTPLDADGTTSDLAAAVTELGVARSTRIATEQAQIGERIASSSVAAARWQWVPTLAVTSQYGLVAYPDTPAPPLDFDEYRDNFTAGIALRFPIFSGGGLHGDLVAARADLAEARARSEQVAELVALDSRDAELSLETAAAQWRAMSQAVTEASRAYEIALVRFREGISTQLELSDARILLQQTEANHARAARDLQVAAVRIRLLPYLPLTPTTAAN